MRVVAIIQARMGSTRLPGKVMMELGGKPLLQNVIERVSRAKLVDAVVVACPTEDWRQFKNFFDSGTFCVGYEGEENDLVGRYYYTAKAFQADLIVRVCADNPLVEPGEIDRLIEYYSRHQIMTEGWLCQNATPFANGYPDGIGAEIYSIKQLEWLNEQNEHPFDREHPHSYFHYTGNVHGPSCPPEFARPDLRLDVNTQEDLDYIRDIYAQFPDNTFHIVDVIKYLNAKDVGMAV